MGVEQPEFALRLVRVRLDRELDQAKAAAAEKAATPKPKFETYAEEFGWFVRDDPRQPLKKLIEGARDWDSLEALADLHPALVLQVLWPWFIECLEAMQIYGGAAIVDDFLALEVDFRFEHDRNGLPEPALLGALRVAAVKMAEVDPERFTTWAEEQEARSLSPALRLVAHAMAENSETFAERSLDFLLGDPRRYFLGSLSDPVSTTQDLVARVGPLWNGDQVSRFEAAMETYQPSIPADADAPLRRAIRRRARRMKLELLRALPSHALSRATASHVQQEARVFGASPFGGGSIEGGFIGSIIDATAMAKASNDDIVNAFETLPDAADWDHPRDFMKGGNIQLSKEFATFAKDHSLRWSTLPVLTPCSSSIGSPRFCRFRRH